MAEDILHKLVENYNLTSHIRRRGVSTRSPFRSDVIGKRNIPVIPFFTTVYVPLLPTPVGEASARRSPRSSRDARSGSRSQSGGMSHFPGTTKYLHPEFDFDRWLLSQFEAGTSTRCST
jgi:hypothetical protein